MPAPVVGMAVFTEGEWQPPHATALSTLREAVEQWVETHPEWHVSARWIDFGGFPCVELAAPDGTKIMFEADRDDPYVAEERELMMA